MTEVKKILFVDEVKREDRTSRHHVEIEKCLLEQESANCFSIKSRLRRLSVKAKHFLSSCIYNGERETFAGA
jgi:hypothetical protein